MNLQENSLYIDALRRINCIGLDGMSIIITGATGLLGSCLIDALMLWNRNQAKPCKVTAISRNEQAAKKRFSYYWNDACFSYVEQDVCDQLAGLPENVDYIIHAASIADPVNIAASPVETLLANVIGTQHLLEYGRSHGMKRFLYVSSGEIYGQPNAALDDFAEDYCGPIDHGSSRACYPAGKRAAEVLCQSYISQYHIDAVIVRPCHIFGPTMKREDSHAVAQFLWSAAMREDIILKSAGLVERSHCYVADAVNAILLVLARGACGKAYNIADRKLQMTIRDFAFKAAEAGGCNVRFENPSDLEKRGYSTIARAVLDPSRLEALGWKPNHSHSAIKETIDILRELNSI